MASIVSVDSFKTQLSHINVTKDLFDEDFNLQTIESQKINNSNKTIFDSYILEYEIYREQTRLQQIDMEIDQKKRSKEFIRQLDKDNIFIDQHYKQQTENLTDSRIDAEHAHKQQLAQFDDAKIHAERSYKQLLYAFEYAQTQLDRNYKEKKVRQEEQKKYNDDYMLTSQGSYLLTKREDIKLQISKLTIKLKKEQQAASNEDVKLCNDQCKERTYNLVKKKTLELMTEINLIMPDDVQHKTPDTAKE